MRLIHSLYRKLLGREATEEEIRRGIRLLTRVRGEDRPDMLGLGVLERILSSPEYWTKSGETRVGWLAAMARDLGGSLGGVPAGSRLEAVQTLLARPSVRLALLLDLYQQAVGGPADEGTRAAFARGLRGSEPPWRVFVRLLAANDVIFASSESSR